MCQTQRAHQPHSIVPLSFVHIDYYRQNVENTLNSAFEAFHKCNCPTSANAGVMVSVEMPSISIFQSTNSITHQIIRVSGERHTKMRSGSPLQPEHLVDFCSSLHRKIQSNFVGPSLLLLSDFVCGFFFRFNWCLCQNVLDSLSNK